MCQATSDVLIFLKKESLQMQNSNSKIVLCLLMLSICNIHVHRLSYVILKVGTQGDL